MLSLPWEPGASSGRPTCHLHCPIISPKTEQGLPTKELVLRCGALSPMPHTYQALLDHPHLQNPEPHTGSPWGLSREPGNRGRMPPVGLWWLVFVPGSPGMLSLLLSI